jgi:hypothetical protein
MTNNLSHLLKPRARYPWRLWLLAAALAVMGGLVAADSYLLANEVAADEARYAKLQALSQVKPLQALSRAQVEDAKRWASLRMERQFPWYPIFGALEQTNHPDIELLEFNPDKTNQSVLLRGEARSVDALVDYLRQLSQQPIFAHVHLTQQKNKPRERITTITFEIRATVRL